MLVFSLQFARFGASGWREGSVECNLFKNKLRSHGLNPTIPSVLEATCRRRRRWCSRCCPCSTSQSGSCPGPSPGHGASDECRWWYFPNGNKKITFKSSKMEFWCQNYFNTITSDIHRECQSWKFHQLSMFSNQLHLIFRLEVASHFATVNVGRSTWGELYSSVRLGLHLQYWLVGMSDRISFDMQ